MAALADDPEFWRAKAKEARETATQLSNEQARRHMLNCAMSYERLAEMAERALAATGGS
jgi:hypothetical protein